MALKLDNNLIDELGLGSLPEQEKQLLLRQIYEKLEMNVGVRLADQMTNEQLDEFEKFVDSNDDKGAFQWLESNFPNYKDVVNEEFEKLKMEIKQYAPQMLAVAAQNAQQPAAPAAGTGTPQPQPMYQSAQAPYPAPGPQMPPQAPYGQQPAQSAQPFYGPQAPQHNQAAYAPAPAYQPQYGEAQPMQQPGQFNQPYPNPVQPTHPGQAPQQSAPGAYPNYPSQQPPAGPGQQ